MAGSAWEHRSVTRGWLTERPASPQRQVTSILRPLPLELLTYVSAGSHDPATILIYAETFQRLLERTTLPPAAILSNVPSDLCLRHASRGLNQ